MARAEAKAPTTTRTQRAARTAKRETFSASGRGRREALLQVPGGKVPGPPVSVQTRVRPLRCFNACNCDRGISQ